MKWRFAYDGLGDDVSKETGTVNDEESMTVQDGKDDADINVIVRRFGIGYEMPAARALARYGDFSEISDYQTALDQVREADEAFMALPASVRSRFGNDAGRLWEFVNDKANFEEAVKLGLVVVEEAVAPQKVEVVNPVVPAGSAAEQPK